MKAWTDSGFSIADVKLVMADDNFLCEIVSQFLLDACLCRQLNDDIIRGLNLCADLWPEEWRGGDDVVSIMLLISGSVAELYIQPMLSCVGDLDVMYHRSDQLAMPEGAAPPTHLPDEFNSRVLVHDIIDSGFTGYVYLMSSYLLTECTDDGHYNAVRCPRRYIGNPTGMELHGPAVVTDHPVDYDIPFGGRVGRSLSTVDQVFCVRCLSWPPQAADWPTRRRNYGWPDSATVDRVVGNGCDVVQVAHRQCRQDEWTSHHQWRLSFSRAEIALLNSWCLNNKLFITCCDIS